jgi:hypothetical protein
MTGAVLLGELSTPRTELIFAKAKVWEFTTKSVLETKIPASL